MKHSLLYFLNVVKLFLLIIAIIGDCNETLFALFCVFFESLTCCACSRSSSFFCLSHRDCIISLMSNLHIISNCLIWWSIWLTSSLILFQKDPMYFARYLLLCLEFGKNVWFLIFSDSNRLYAFSDFSVSPFIQSDP